MNLLDLIFPKRCVSCRKVGKYFCNNCTAKIKFITHQICPVCEKAAIDGATHPRCKTRYSIDGLTAFFHYEGPIRQAVKLVKYRFVSDLAKEFISLIPITSLQSITHLPAQAGNLQPTTLIPIPLHSSRQKFRGFNQAEVLGRLLAKRLNISVRPDILKRIKKTTAQVEMKDRKKRLVNMEKVFSIQQLLTTNYQPPTILLFDDVFTTGATLRSAANILKRAGAKSVWGIVMAHG